MTIRLIFLGGGINQATVKIGPTEKPVISGN